MKKRRGTIHHLLATGRHGSDVPKRTVMAEHGRIKNDEIRKMPSQTESQQSKIHLQHCSITPNTTC